LTPKGEKYGSKQVSPKGGGFLPNVDQSKYLPKEEDVFQMGEKYGEKQRGKIMDLGGGQADIG
jgi:hypothetical protein